MPDVSLRSARIDALVPGGLQRRRLLARTHALDVHLFRSVAATDLPIAGPVLRPLSRLADRSVLWTGLAVLLAVAGGRAGRRAAVRGMGCVLATSAIANLPAKRAFPRSRPGLAGFPVARLIRRMPASSSMPSGHSASAFAFATGAGAELPLGVAVPLWGLAATVSLSRVYVGAHYPFDVVAGAALGVAVGAASRRAWPVAAAPPRPERPGTVDHTAPACPGGEGVTIVVNPGAGSALRDDLADRLRSLLPAARIVEPGEGEDLEEVLRREAAGCRVLGMCGGDGSQNCATGVAMAAGLPLLVIPGGTLNHLARDLGLGSAEDAVGAVERGEAVRVDVGRIADRPFLNTASLGAYTDLVDMRERLQGRLGKWPAVAVATARVMRTAQPVHVRLDGVERHPWLVFAGNGRYWPGGVTPASRPRLDDGLLDIRFLEGAPRWPRLRLALSALTGTLERTSAFQCRTATSLTVEWLDGNRRLARDGETFDGPRSFRVEKQDRALTVYVPAR